MNLGYRWGDSRENVDENRRRVAEVAGYDGAELQVTKHVHGIDVWVVGDRAPDPPEFDALVTNRPGATVAAFAADCIPIVFADRTEGESKMSGHIVREAIFMVWRLRWWALTGRV